MAFWQENYAFIKVRDRRWDDATPQDVYDTRVCKMVEWMDHLEMAISKVQSNMPAYTDLLCSQGYGHQSLH